jgi:hypothetical protein
VGLVNDTGYTVRESYICSVVGRNNSDYVVTGTA